MKHLLCVFFAMLLFSGAYAQSLLGAWESTVQLEGAQQHKKVLIVAEGYQVLTVFDASSGKFIHTNGGTWSLRGKTMTEKVEFHTDNASTIGKEFSFDIKLTDTTLQIVGHNEVFTRIDDGGPGKLAGAWIMSGRVRNGTTQLRDTSRPRKTMKLLSGKRFQWIAYNIETREFKGTGGGSYTTKNGKYTENIEFFSRDSSRVGASLQFDFSLMDGQWHHKGFSSKGKPLHEIWSLRE